MTYNKSEIMKRAWEIFKGKKLIGEATYDMVKHNKPIATWAMSEVFPQAVKQAWREAKLHIQYEKEREENKRSIAEANAKREAEIAAMTPAERIADLEYNLFMLNMIDFQSFEDKQAVLRIEAEIKRIKDGTTAEVA